MERIKKLELAKSLGYTCNFETGQIFGIKNGKELKSNAVRITNRYIKIYLKNENKYDILFGHHLIWFMFYGEDVPEGYVIDHINRNPSDNRIENLRLVTQQENSFNTNAKGCTWNKRDKKWQARISINNKTIYLGYFDTEKEAHEAYLDAKIKYHLRKNN